jgi:hypothetical protein
MCICVFASADYRKNERGEWEGWSSLKPFSWDILTFISRFFVSKAIRLNTNLVRNDF